MNKLLLFLLLSASLAFAWSGSGTYEDPYEIATDADIADLAYGTQTNSYSGVYFLQTADITFTEGYTWQMYVIGALALDSSYFPFSGSYDGDGYSVYGLDIETSTSGASTNAFGLFGYCENATIENVSVYGKVKVNATYNDNACVGVGGVVGIMRRGLFVGLNNYCDIDVKISNASSGNSSAETIRYGVGGVIGFNSLTENNATQNIGCENYGNIYVDGVNGYGRVGGCFTALVRNGDTYTSFVGFNNYGKIIVNGTAESATATATLVGGVCSFRHTANDVNRTPRVISCSNFGEILCSNSVHTAGISAKGLSASNYSSRQQVSYSTNYADVVSIDNATSNGRKHTSGISVDLAEGMDALVFNCVNFGKVKLSGTLTATPHLSGISCGSYGTSSADFSYGNKNFGSLKADCPNVPSVVCGGISALVFKNRLHDCENYGNISINTSGSVLIGGIACSAASFRMDMILRDCVNFGNITASGNANTNYSPCVGGVLASTRITSDNTRNVVLSNCYNLGQAKLNLNSPDCYGSLYGVANTYGSYSVSVKNCYAILGEGQNLIGAVDASNGNVSLENCVGIKSGREGGIAYSVSGSNNWSQVGTQIVSYEDCYTNPYQCYGNMGSGIFFPADKTTNYFDLILPINTKLYPTPSATDKKNHTYTKARGYKRYVKTNRK